MRRRGLCFGGLRGGGRGVGFGFGFDLRVLYLMLVRGLVGRMCRMGLGVVVVVVVALMRTVRRGLGIDRLVFIHSLLVPVPIPH